MYTGITTAMKPCGELMCAAYQLCLPHDMQCYPCNSYCDKNSNNFDGSYCDNQCQDYIDKLKRDNDSMYNAFASTTGFIWIMFFAIIVFGVLIMKPFVHKIYAKPKVISTISSSQTIPSAFKKENGRD